MNPSGDREVRHFPTTDTRLGWVSVHDPKSLGFASAEAITPQPEVAKLWTPGVTLDQGREGACVGFGWTAELLATPRSSSAPYEVANPYALGFYHGAQGIDREMGYNFDSGASVLAGAKLAQRRGQIDTYRWALSIEDVRNAVIAEGPVVLGIPWLYDMYWTEPSGLVKVGGDVVGGHCITVIGYHPRVRLIVDGHYQYVRAFKWRNSWGTDYGKGGSGWVRYEDLRDLLSEDGDACVPMGRRKVTLAA